MIHTKKIFYLTSSESKSFGVSVRKCEVVKSIKYGKRDDLALVRIEPVYSFEDEKNGYTEYDELILASRYEGNSIFKIQEWPIYVHVAVKVQESVDYNNLREGDLKKLAWAEIYPDMQSINKVSN